MGNDFRRGIRVYLETSDYAKGITELVQQNHKLNKEYEGLKTKADQLSVAEKKRLTQLENQIKKNAETEVRYKQKLQETEKVLKNLSGSTYNELIRVQKQLEREMKDARGDVTRFNAALEQHKKVTNEVNKAKKEMNLQMGASGNMFSRSANFLNKYFITITSFIAGITGLSMTFRKLSEDVAKMDDVYSDVMKTTNMTREEVLALNEEFKKMDTRTSREALNNLARDAGKLGLEGKKNILDFVDAGNQIKVALGEDLGEDAIKNVGKMVDVFTKSTNHLQNLDLKGKMLAVGSAINTLGASSSANEDYLVQFAGRLGGVATQAGISIDAILGYGSALDQDMQQVEMSATALQNFIMKIMGEPAKFAKVAGMSVRDFSNLLNTDANTAIKTVLRSLNEKGGFQQLIPIFNEMGLDGARAVGVLSSMAGSIDKIDAAQKVANQSLLEGTSITKEYSIKNQNQMAALEKARKGFQEMALELGAKLNPILLKSTNITTAIIKLFVQYPAIIYTITAALGALAIVYSGLYAVKIKNNIVDKAKIIIDKAHLIVTQLQTLAQAALTGNIVATRVAWQALNTTMKANVIMGIIALIAALAIGIYKLATNTTAAEKAYNNFQAEANKASRELNNIFDAYKKANEGTAEKARLLEIIKQKYGQYIQNLIDEKGNIIDIKKAQEQANNALRQSIALKIRNAQADEISNKLMKDAGNSMGNITKAITDIKGTDLANSMSTAIGEIFNTNTGDPIKAGNAVRDYLKKNGIDIYKSAGFSMAGPKNINKFINELASTYYQINKQTGELDQKFSGLIGNLTTVEDVIVPGTTTTGGGGGTTPTGDKPNEKKTDPAEEAIKDAEEKFKQKLINERYWLELGQITEEDFANKGYDLQMEFMNKKLEIEQKYGKSTIDTENAILDLRNKRNQTADEALLAVIKQANDSKLAALTELDNVERQKLQDQVDDGLLTNSAYQAKVTALDLVSAKTRTNIAKDYLTFVENSEFSTTDAKEKAVKEAQKVVEDATKAETDATKKANRAKIKADEDYQKEREALLKQYGLLSIREQYNQEIAELKKSLDKKLLTEEEYERARKQIKLKYAEQGAQTAVQFAGMIADAVTAYHQMEFDSLDAMKQKELTAAGNNAEKRKQIEADYAQKELDLKKKQANSDATIKIAQTIAAGALAVVQAFAQLGPIAGTIAGVIIAGTTALQIGSIIKQRDAIMATTLDSSSSGGSDTPTSSGARVVTQYADGKYDVIGASDGRTYRNVPYRGNARTGIYSGPVLVSEQGDEMVISNPDLRRMRMDAPAIYSGLSRFVTRQYASGKYDAVNNTSGSLSSIDYSAVTIQLENNTEVMMRVAELLAWLKENKIEAYTLLSEFEKKRDLRDKSLKKGSVS